MKNPAKLLLIALIKLLLLQICASSDTILANESIKDGDVIISSGEIFTLGFFSPSTSMNRYVGIWYTKVPLGTVVWVANRDNPINDSSGVLSINSQGNLVLYDKYRSVPVWSANVSVSSPSNSAAKILDSGNFVLVQQDTNAVLWQSFDHLTHVMLPFTKLGVNHRTGLRWFITCWKSPNDPGSGNWSYWLSPGGAPELILFSSQLLQWRSGPWDGTRWNGMPDGATDIFYGIDNVNNDTETTLGWGILNTSIITMLFVDRSGFVKRATWSDENQQWKEFWSMPKEPCDYYGHCGTYGNCDPYSVGQFECICLPGFEPNSPDDWRLRDGSGGCVRKRGPLTCQGEGFVKVSNAKVPNTSLSVVDMNLDLNTCERECLKNCSCTAYSSALASKGVGCLRWYGDLIDTRVFVEGGQDLYVRVDAVELALYAKKSKSSKERILAILFSTFAVIVLFTIASLWWLKKRREEGDARPELPIDCTALTSNGGTIGRTEFDEHESPSLPIFDVNSIIAATDNFSSTNKVGQGGFGTVYKGQLANGQEIAVKRLSATSRQGTEEFKNEVRLISKLQHKNLVRLFGCCIHKSERMLVYEYLPNKSLDFFIFDNSRRSLLDWAKRFEIIIGIARGLLYLHQDSRLKIIHRDLKPSNVLLDAVMNPKISDFVMARIFGEDQTEANTNKVVGTYGYMSPEYAMEGTYSIKSDVFSYGVLVLEIVSGRKNNNFFVESGFPNLIGQVWDLWREGKALEIVDSSLGCSYPQDEALRCIQIGLLCVQESPTDRPSMLTAMFMLGNDTITLPSPNKPAFIERREFFHSDSSTTRADSSSINNMSITETGGR